MKSALSILALIALAGTAPVFAQERPERGDRPVKPKDGERPREGERPDRPKDGERPDKSKDGEHPQEGDRPNLHKLKEELANHDADGDGELSKDEFPGPDKIFERLDTDKSGKISLRELTQKAKEFATALGKFRELKQRFEQADKDGDGKISAEEWTGEAGVFKRADKNSDGFLDKAELIALVRASMSAEDAPKPDEQRGDREKFKKCDKDNDGKISADEFEGDKSLFDRIDADKDGFLSHEEFASYQKSLRERIDHKRDHKEGDASDDARPATDDEARRRPDARPADRETDDARPEKDEHKKDERPSSPRPASPGRGR